MPPWRFLALLAALCGPVLSFSSTVTLACLFQIDATGIQLQKAVDLAIANVNAAGVFDAGVALASRCGDTQGSATVAANIALDAIAVRALRDLP